MASARVINTKSVKSQVEEANANHVRKDTFKVTTKDISEDNYMRIRRLTRKSR